MKYFLLCIFCAFGSLGQRGIVVNKRARQRLPIPYQDSESSKISTDNNLQRKPVNIGRRQRDQQSSFEPSSIQSRFDQPYQASFFETPYYEQGALQRAQSFGQGALQRSESFDQGLALQPFDQGVLERSQSFGERTFDSSKYDYSESEGAKFAPSYPESENSYSESSNSYSESLNPYSEPESPYFEVGQRARQILIQQESRDLVISGRTSGDRSISDQKNSLDRSISDQRISVDRSNSNRRTSSADQSIDDRRISVDRSMGDRRVASQQPTRTSGGRVSSARRNTIRDSPSRRTVRRRTNDVVRRRSNSLNQQNSISSEVDDKGGRTRGQENTQSTRSRSRSRFRARTKPSQSQAAESRTAAPLSVTPTRVRSRGRSRFRGSSQKSSQTSSEAPSRTFSKERSSSRLPSRPSLRLQPRVTDTAAASRIRGSGRQNRRIETQEPRRDREKESNRKIFRVKFPRKGLVTTPEIKSRKDVSDSRSVNRIRTDIKPTRTRPEPRPEVEPDVYTTPPEIQSSKLGRDIIVVTHQVPAKTIFTVTEGRETKSLFIDTYTTSLQRVSIAELKSTYIDESPVIYAHSTTTQGFGLEETLIDAIHPTRTALGYSTSTFYGRDARETVSTDYSTIYNVQTITVRNTASLASLQATPDINQIGSLLQNVILGLLGGNLLGVQNPGLLGLGGLGQIGQPNLLAPQTSFITHTRSCVTTATETDTLLVPVNFRGSQITQTVTDTSTKVYTTTDTSVQTLIQPGIATNQPFLPLAPTLHRATRVVETAPVYPLGAPLLPTPHLTVLTHTSAIVTTLDKDVTTDVVITLGGREVTTQFVQPSKQVLTLTNYSTQTVTLQPPQQQQQNGLNQLALLRAILKLRG